MTIINFYDILLLGGVKWYNESKGVDILAEFCKECYLKTFGSFVEQSDRIIESKRELDLCEGCGKVKPVVIKVRKKRFWEK